MLKHRVNVRPAPLLDKKKTQHGPGTLPREMKTSVFAKTYIQKFIEALFVIAKK